MEKVLLTRQEIETRLERGLTGKLLQYETVRNDTVIGKLQRLAVNDSNGELLVNFQLDRIRYECDLQYFVENTIILNGNTSGGNTASIRRVLKGD
jgi:3-phenylpropionate/cinnamic acid dioxygenase small subunit